MSDMFPTPYTAAQLRDATESGRTYCWRVEQDGKATIVRIMMFHAATNDGVDLQVKVESETGLALSDPPPRRVDWEELRKHAEFPRARTTTREETVTVPAGTFDCLVYEVEDEKDPASSKTFFFAKNLPGAPVLQYTERAGQRGETQTLVEYVPRNLPSSMRLRTEL